LVPALLLGSVMVLRANGLTTRPPARLNAAATASMSPASLTEAAATALEQATAAGAPGYTFDIVQHATLAAHPGGPLIEVPDPLDRTKSLGDAASYALGTYLERGSATPAGFHAEIRRGLDDPTATADWAKQPLELAALVRAGTTYRNDGEGWYETARPPGIGLDPATAGLLPTMLRSLGRLADGVPPEPGRSASPEPGRAVADPFAALAPARRLEGESKVADIPGIIAVDLAGATELLEPAELAFDDAARLVGLRVLARNIHLDRFDLLVETVITFAYPESTPELPKPEPIWVAPSAPSGGE
jgi:hypothetical protein